MATNIGPRIGVDGYNTYKAEMKQIAAEIENYKAKCDALGNSAEDLKKKEDLLTQAIKLQADAIAKQTEWNNKVENAVNSKSNKTERDTAVLTENQTVLVKQQTELQKLTNEYDKLGNETEESENRVTGAMIALGELTARLIEKTIELAKNAAQIGINYNASMESAQAALTTLLGDSEEAKSALEQVKEMSKIAPTFSTESLLKASQMIIATGKDAETATQDVYALANAIAASGGGNDELVRMAQNLQQIGNAGKSTSMDIKQFANAGIAIYPILADYMGITVEEASKLKPTYEQIAGALRYAASEGGKYFGGLEAQAQTFNGQVSALKKNLQEGLGYATEELVSNLESDIIPKLNDFLKNTDNIDKAVSAFKAFAAVTTEIAAASKITKFLTGSSTAAKLLTGRITLAKAGLAALPFAEVLAGIAAITLAVKACNDEVGRVKSLGVLGDGKSVREYENNVDVLKKKVAELQKQYDSLAESGGDLTAIEYELSDAKSALINAEKELAEATAAVNEEQEKANELESKAVPQERVNSIIENAKSRIQELKAAYDEYYNAALEASQKEFDLFEEVGKLQYTSTTTLQKNLQTQIDYWDAYKVNLELVKDAQSGLSQELITFLSDGTTESAGYLSSIVADVMQAGGFTSEKGQEIVSNLNTKFAELQNSQQGYAQETANALSDIGNQIKDTVDNAKSKLKEMDVSQELYLDGVNDLNQFIAGLGTQVPYLQAQAYSWGQSVSVQMQNGVNSVSLQLPRIVTGYSGIRVGSGILPGFAKGLDYVPKDNYIAALHKGEMVLTAAQANAVRSGAYQRSIANAAYNYGGVNINVYGAEGQSADEIAEAVNLKLQHAVERREEIYK